MRVPVLLLVAVLMTALITACTVIYIRGDRNTLWDIGGDIGPNNLGHTASQGTQAASEAQAASGASEVQPAPRGALINRYMQQHH
jgi:hypothetical protein